jgi:hypothetical protein
MKPFTKRVAEVKIVLSPSSAQYQDARTRYSEITNVHEISENPNVWDSLIEARTATLVLENVSIREAEAIAEPIRIMFPDQHVNIYGSDNSGIGNVTWNDQLKMFWGYPTYTEIGKAIMTKRKEEQDALGIQASWE